MEITMVRRFGLVVLLLPTLALAAPAADQPETYPAHILIIRHAEKPPDEAMSPHLSAAGKARAEMLPKLFRKADNRTDPFPTPDFLVADSLTKKSNRPNETVAPLAKALGQKVNDHYGDADSAKLADKLFHNPKYAGKTVLICWRHHDIPELAKTSAPSTHRMRGKARSSTASGASTTTETESRRSIICRSG